MITEKGGEPSGELSIGKSTPKYSALTRVFSWRERDEVHSFGLSAEKSFP